MGKRRRVGRDRVAVGGIGVPRVRMKSWDPNETTSGFYCDLQHSIPIAGDEELPPRYLLSFYRRGNKSTEWFYGNHLRLWAGLDPDESSLWAKVCAAVHLARLRGHTFQWTTALGVGWRAWILLLICACSQLVIGKGTRYVLLLQAPIPMFPESLLKEWSFFFYRLDWQLRGTNLLYSGATAVWCGGSASRHLHFPCAFHSSRGRILQILWPLQFQPVWWSECGESYTKSFLIFLTLSLHLALGLSKSCLVQGAILTSIFACCKMSILSNNTAQ